MPLYEYKCEEGHMWEINVPSASRDDEHLCPDCNTNGKRLYGVGGVEFKARGFYTTDNRKIGK